MCFVVKLLLGTTNYTKKKFGLIQGPTHARDAESALLELDRKAGETLSYVDPGAVPDSECMWRGVRAGGLPA